MARLFPIEKRVEFFEDDHERTWVGTMWRPASSGEVDAHRASADAMMRVSTDGSARAGVTTLTTTR
jgi:hypothetical protein